MKMNLKILNLIILLALSISIIFGFKANAQEKKGTDYGIVVKSESSENIQKLVIYQEKTVELLEEIRDILKKQDEARLKN